MDRIGDYLVCTICKRKFFTKTGFQIHNKKEHCIEHSSLEAKRPAESSIRFQIHNKKEHSTLEAKATSTENFISSNETSNSITKTNKIPIIKENSGNTIDKTFPIKSDDDFQDSTLSSHKIVSNKVEENSANSKTIIPDKKSDQIFKCDICQKGFKLENKWKHHLEVGHKENQRFHCHKCDKQFKAQRSLTRHTKRIHSKIQPFPCQKCDKKFAEKFELKNHSLATHEKIKPFHCQKCDKTFFRKRDLNSHINIIHDKIKNFHCQICKKSFLRNKYLIQHTRNIHEKNITFLLLNVQQKFP
jgi:hypothetical protein